LLLHGSVSPAAFDPHVTRSQAVPQLGEDTELENTAIKTGSANPSPPCRSDETKRGICW